MPGKSKLTANDEERAALRTLSKSEQRGEADRARAVLLTLEGRRGGEITAALGGIHVSTVRNWRAKVAASSLEYETQANRLLASCPITQAGNATDAHIDFRERGGWVMISRWFTPL